MPTVFISYSHKDENLKDQLGTQLSALEHRGLIDAWHDRKILAGDEFSPAISDELDRAALILLLVSSDFLASRYVHDKEVPRAMERQKAGEARVIPIILRPCDWRNEPFGGLLAAPTDGKPVTQWRDRDAAFLDVVTMIRGAVQSPNSALPEKPPSAELSDLKGLGDALDIAAGSIIKIGKNVAVLDPKANSARNALKDVDARLNELTAVDQVNLRESITNYVESSKETEASSDGRRIYPTSERASALNNLWRQVVDGIDQVLRRTTKLLDAINADRSDFVLEDARKTLLVTLNEKISILVSLRGSLPPQTDEQIQALEAAARKFDRLREATSAATDEMSKYIKAIPP